MSQCNVLVCQPSFVGIKARYSRAVPATEQTHKSGLEHRLYCYCSWKLLKVTCLKDNNIINCYLASSVACKGVVEFIIILQIQCHLNNADREKLLFNRVVPDCDNQVSKHQLKFIHEVHAYRSRAEFPQLLDFFVTLKYLPQEIW